MDIYNILILTQLMLPNKRFTYVTGVQFKSMYPPTEFTFYKLTRKDETHFGFQYKTGLNVDTVPFNPKGSCLPGGLYFTSLNKLPVWISKDIEFVREVEILDDSLIYANWIDDLKSVTKFKADKFILKERQLLIDMPQWEDEAYCTLAVTHQGNNLLYCKVLNDEIYWAALRKNPRSLAHIHKDAQTYDMCEYAVTKCPPMLRHVNEMFKTQTLCLNAYAQYTTFSIAPYIPPEFFEDAVFIQNVVYTNANTFVTLPEHCRTNELALIAVSKNGCLIRHVIQQTKELCLAAVNQTGIALQYVAPLLKTFDICYAAVMQNEEALLYCGKHKTPLTHLAVGRNPKAIQYTTNPSEELCLSVVEREPSLLQYITDPSPKVIDTALSVDSNAIKYYKPLRRSERLANKRLKSDTSLSFCGPCLS